MGITGLMVSAGLCSFLGTQRESDSLTFLVAQWLPVFPVHAPFPYLHLSLSLSPLSLSLLSLPPMLSEVTSPL
jgi:hypothetical protein